MANAVFCCGRMNPPTIGHMKLVKRMDEFAMQHDAEVFVFTTLTEDSERNPLSPDMKQSFLSRAFEREIHLTKSPLSAVDVLVEKGIEKATLFVGEDRYSMAMAVYQYGLRLGIEVKPEIISRPVDDVSASEVREAAARGDFEMFCTLVPAPDQDFQSELYHAVRCGMEVMDGIVRESTG